MLPRRPARTSKPRQRGCSSYFLVASPLFSFLLLLLLRLDSVSAQGGCSNTCPPINYGLPVPSLCEGDNAADFADIEKVYTVCHPSAQPVVESFSLQDFRGNITVIANFYVGCNAGRRESGVYAHTAQRYYDDHQGAAVRFVTSLKGGSTCAQWAGMYQRDALQLFPNSSVTPVDMPLTVLDQEYELRDDFFTTPFGHPSYVILDQDLQVRHKFIGPCCGYESYYDCTPEIARSLDDTLSGYLDALLQETDENQDGPSMSTPSLPTASPVGGVIPPLPTNDNDDDVPPCSVGNFSQWSDCSVTCGEGIQFRWRTVVVMNDGTANNNMNNTNSTMTCPAPVETRSCRDETDCQEDDGCVQEFGKTHTIQTVATGFDGPRDVAFHPTPGYHLGNYSEGRVFHPPSAQQAAAGGGEQHEAWVVNGLNHSISIVASLGHDKFQTTISRRDRGYYHYMINVTALAFNTVANSGRSGDRDTFNYWAVCNDNRNTYQDTKEANNFMGPTLYDSNPANLNLVNRLGQVCGDDEECYFLHADMLHESPECIGIAHDPETVTAYGTVFWAFDSLGNGQNGQLVRFDFQQPHGPGSMDHSVAAVRRFPDVKLTRGPPGVHAGMVVHPATRELFVAEPGADRIIVVQADSGSYARTAREEYPIFSNRLPSFEYSIWECPEQRIFASDIDTPSGLALSNDGERLFATERATGDIVVFEVASGAVLTRISTGLLSIGGMSMSPDNVLHFVDEETNSLYAIKMDAECDSFAQSRLSPSFVAAVEEAKQVINGAPGSIPFSLYRDYACVVDPIVPDSAFFDQVHEDTGYASDNPDVQSMAGMDAEAALLANRTDCDYTSELNFDGLLLGGYYCHQCLPGDDGAMCDIGGECRNVQWSGYVCDNEFLVLENAIGDLQLLTPDGIDVDASQLILKTGVTYRFTIRTDKDVCLTDANSGPIAVLGNDSGCASRGPLLVDVTESLPDLVALILDGGPSVLIRTETGMNDSKEESGAVKDTADTGSSGPDVAVIVGVVVPLVVLVLAIGAFFLSRRAKLSKNESPETVEECNTSEYPKEGGSPARTGSSDNSDSEKLDTSKDSSEELKP